MTTITSISTTVAAATIIFLSVLNAGAQGSGEQHGGGQPPGGASWQAHHPPKPPIDSALDANSDDVINAGEIASASSVIATLDRNGDGLLSGDECLPRRPAMRGNQGGGTGMGRQGYGQGGDTGMGGQDGGPGGGNGQRSPQPPIFTCLDSNGDGSIGDDEIANASASLSKLDKDGDGSLSASEYRPPRPGGDAGPGADGGSRGNGSGVSRW